MNDRDRGQTWWQRNAAAVKVWSVGVGIGIAAIVYFIGVGATLIVADHFIEKYW